MLVLTVIAGLGLEFFLTVKIVLKEKRWEENEETH